MIKNSLTLCRDALANWNVVFGEKLPILKWMVFEVTNACNSRCTHCSIWRTEPIKNMLSPKEIKDVFQDELFKNLKHIIITGGEPVLRKDLKDIILAIHEALPNTSLTLSTNGLLPTRVVEATKYAMEQGICIYVGISLDGLGERHDAIRGMKNNFKKIEELIQELSNLKKDYKDKIKIGLAHTLSKKTADTLHEVKDYAAGVGFTFFTQLCEEFAYYDNLRSTDDNDNYEQISVLEQLSPSVHNEILLKSLKKKRPIKYRCFSLKTFFLMRCNGDITPCLRHCDYRVGNVRESSPSEIWRSLAAKEARNFIKKCVGCSNTWATSWSLIPWFPSFLDILIKYKIKKTLFNLNSFRMETK